jgi:hydroxymethylglutaryl-CoA lyase
MSFKIIECPRDAMQGLHRFIPTGEKAAYINKLLKAGFDTLDFGSFVSPKSIPQMKDTAAVLQQLHTGESKTKLLAIVANLKGADQVCEHPEISCLGFPFSISETFQLRNTNATMEEAFRRMDAIQNRCTISGKELVVYISMGFGNPYGDPWNADIVNYWAGKIAEKGVKTISLSDTVGIATPESIRYLFSHLIPEHAGIEFGAHLHTLPYSWKEKIEAAYESGCRRFDGAIKGYGGCPMAADELTGNMPTEFLLDFSLEKEESSGISRTAFDEALLHATQLFNVYA